MKLTKKLNVTLILVLVCLVLVIGASYAWLTMAMRPEVQRIETNVGANGSLEIALLTDQTFEDPTLITTTIGDSAVKQNVKESNRSWGNVIQLSQGYGLDEITLLPARLNVTRNEEDVLAVGRSLLKTAEFGIDGRMKVLSDETVSTILEGEDFTYYVGGQRYGVRAIGTISNLTSQQIALATSRSLIKSYTVTATRMVENTWRDYGAGIVDIFYRHYALGREEFTDEDVTTVQSFAKGIQEAMEYVDDAMRQTIIGLMATRIKDEPDFEFLCDQISISKDNASLSNYIQKEYVGNEYYDALYAYAEAVDRMRTDAQNAVANSLYLAREQSWGAIESVLSYLLSPGQAYLGEKLLSDSDAFGTITQDNVILVPADSGVMGKLADYTGNFSAFATWKDNISMEARTATMEEEGFLLRMQTLLDKVKASTGGWTRANMDDLYGFAIDLAFRCNEPSQLLLQTRPESRVEGNSENPVTQGSGSYMKFGSDNMDTDRLIKLMDTIRVGFLSDRGELLGVAKLNLSNSVEEEGEIYAPLYLYEHEVEESGRIAIVRRSEDAVIMDLPQNAPVIVTVVVWLDGDHVDNSMVSEIAHESMDGVLNLQFSGSADLIPSGIGMKTPN